MAKVVITRVEIEDGDSTAAVREALGGGAPTRPPQVYDGTLQLTNPANGATIGTLWAKRPGANSGDPQFLCYRVVDRALLFDGANHVKASWSGSLTDLAMVEAIADEAEKVDGAGGNFHIQTYGPLFDGLSTTTVKSRYDAAYYSGGTWSGEQWQIDQHLSGTTTTDVGRIYRGRVTLNGGHAVSEQWFLTSSFGHPSAAGDYLLLKKVAAGSEVTPTAYVDGKGGSNWHYFRCAYMLAKRAT